MINEYLFLTAENKITVETYKPPDDVNVEIFSMKNASFWGVKYSLLGNNENSAKKLSEVHIFMLQYAPLVLSCGSSEYYNRALFPLINELERKLRKLLYAAALLSDNEEAKENIKHLEEKDFGEIFNLLFVDPNFILNMKKRINADAKSEFNGKDKYSKAEIQSHLDSLDEHTLWDVILNANDVSTLRNRFREVQAYRNKVMHAQNIDKKLFNKSRSLFKKINRELDDVISRLVRIDEDGSEERKLDVNEAISSALRATDLSAPLETLKAISAGANKALSAYADTFKHAQSMTLSLQSVASEALAVLLPFKMNTLIEPFRTTVFQVSSITENFNRQINDMMKSHNGQMEKMLQPYKTFAGSQEENNSSEKSC